MCSGGGGTQPAPTAPVNAPPAPELLAPTDGGQRPMGQAGTEEVNQTQPTLQTRRQDFNTSSLAASSGSGLRM